MQMFQYGPMYLVLFFALERWGKEIYGGTRSIWQMLALPGEQESITTRKIIRFGYFRLMGRKRRWTMNEYVCHCGLYTENWNHVGGKFEAEDYEEEVEYVDDAGVPIDEEDLCTRRIIVTDWGVRILEDHTGLKADCGLPVGLCDALCDILQRNADGELPSSSEKSYEDQVFFVDEHGDSATLDCGFLTVEGQNYLTIDLSDEVFAAMYKAFVEFGGTVENGEV